MKIVKRRASAKVDGGLDFILSDATPDHLGDIIDQSGWDLQNFTPDKNPIALFNHKGSEPIGRWRDVHVEGGALRGRLEFAEAGTSDRIDEIRSLSEQGILRAASVGFKPIEYETFKNGDYIGIHFKRQKLLEVSLVSIPANPNALQIAKAFLSAETIDLVFGKLADPDQDDRRRLMIGKLAAIPQAPKGVPMSTTLQKLIEDGQARLVVLKDALTAHLATIDDNNVTDEFLAKRDELNAKIEREQRLLDGNLRSETVLGVKSTIVVPKAPEPEQRNMVAVIPSASTTPRPPVWALPKKPEAKPGEHTMRALVGLVVGKLTGISPEQAIAQRYGEDGRVDEMSLMVLRGLNRPEGIQLRDLTNLIVTRTATAPADTATSGWASQLVQTDIAAFMPLLMPASVLPGLRARGLAINLGRNGVVRIPTRLATPTIAGAFIAEGAAIPVKQGAFTSQDLGPKRMGVISTFTRQLAQHSTPAIEQLIRDQIAEDTSAAVDAVLLDSTAATTIRPAGLRAGVSVITATAGGGFNALVGDLKNLINALVTSSAGNLRSPTWIMNPAEALSISVTQNAGGDFPFAQEINQKRFAGYPVIVSSTVTAKMVILVDAADFVTVDGDVPQYSVSDQATLHMDDAAIAISAPGSPNTVAAPVRSLYQTDTLAIRMLWDINWAMRRTGMVAWTQTVTW